MNEVEKKWRAESDPAFAAQTDVLRLAIVVSEFGNKDDVLRAYTFAWLKLKYAVEQALIKDPTLLAQIEAARNALPKLDQMIDEAEWNGDEPSDEAIALINERWRARHLDELGEFIDTHLRKEASTSIL
jgi:hypothetical protein